MMKELMDCKTYPDWCFGQFEDNLNCTTPFHCVTSKDNPFGVKFIHSLLSYFCNSCTYSKHRVALCTLTVLKLRYDQVLGGRFYSSPLSKCPHGRIQRGKQENRKLHGFLLGISNWIRPRSSGRSCPPPPPPPPPENVGPPLEPWKRIVNIPDGPEPPPLPLKKIPGSAHGPLTIN